MNTDELTLKTRHAAQVCAAVVIGIALLAGVGWLAQNLILAGFANQYIPMAPGTAISFTVLGLTLLVWARWPQMVALGGNRTLRGGSFIVLGGVISIGFLPFIRIFSPIDIEGFLFGNNIFKTLVTQAGSMSPITACLLIANALILGLLRTNPEGRTSTRPLAAATGTITFLSGSILSFWYLYGQPLLFNSPVVYPAFNTAIAFCFLGAGLIALVTPQVGWLRYLAGQSLQARLLRAFLPTLFLISLLANLIEDVWIPNTINHAAWSLVVMIVGSGILAAVVWFITRDIANQLDQAQQALHASEQKFRGVVEQSVDGMVLTDEQGRITEWNAAQEAITGLARVKAIGRPIWEVQFEQGLPDTQTPERLQGIQKMFQQALFTGVGDAINRPIEMPLRRANGGERVVQSLAFPINTGRGIILCGFSRDITRRKQAEEALFWELAENAALSTLYKPLIAPNTSTTIIAHAILEQAQSLTGSAFGYVATVDPLSKAIVGHTLSGMMDRSMIDGQERSILFRLNADGRYDGLWGYALNTRQAFYTNDPQNHPAAGTPQGHAPLEQFLSTPVMLGDELVGQIALSNPGRDYTDHDLDALKRLGEYYALAIQRQRAESDVQHKVFQLALLNDVGSQIAALLDINRIFERAVYLIHESFYYDHVGLFLYDSDQEELVLRAKAGSFSELFRPDHRLNINQGIVGWVARNRVYLLANDVNQEPNYVCITSETTPTQSELAIPLQIGGKLLGVLDIQSSRLNAFSENDIKVVETLANQVAVALENARLFEAAQQELAERKRAEQALRESEERYRLLFTQVNEGFALHEIICDQDGTPVDYQFLEINPAFERLTGLLASDVVGNTVFEVMPETEAYWVDTYGRVALTGEPVTLENYSQVLGRWYRVSAFSPTHGRFATIFTDITSQKELEETLRHERNNLLKIFHTVPIGMMLVDEQTTITEANVTLGNMLLRDPAEMIGKRAGEGLLCIHSTEDPRGCGFSHTCPNCPLRQGMDSVLQQGASIHNSEICITLLIGGQPSDRWLNINAEPILIDNRRHVVIAIEDITERKLAEHQLQTMLAEKDVLLKEIHHRVKNNLQIVNSLLSLHAEAIEDPVAAQAFQDCQNNVRAIAQVHETIYRSQNLAEIDAAEYLPNLLSHLRKALGHQPSEILLQVDIQHTTLDVENAIPCGLIITELFTNAYKHAFPPDFSRQGQAENWVWVDFGAINGKCVLSVRDNGIGLPAGFDLTNTHSLGLQLVGMLAQQLQGKLEVVNEQGVTFRVVFPGDDPASRLGG